MALFNKMTQLLIQKPRMGRAKFTVQDLIVEEELQQIKKQID
jgi:hypothetical protein